MSGEGPSGLEDAVKRFVAHERAAKLAELKLETTLFGDLGINGDDAYELLGAFSQRFHVNLSELDFRRHFHGEVKCAAGCRDLLLTACLVLSWPYLLFRLWRGWRPWEKPRSHTEYGKVPIRISDLIRAAQTGRLTTRELEPTGPSA